MIFAFKELARWFRKFGMQRPGKTPKVLIVCEDEGQRRHMAAILESDVFMERGGFMQADVPMTKGYEYEGTLSGIPYKLITEQEMSRGRY